MNFDIPTDLINKSQIGFRTAAGLSNFDRNDTTLPSIPPLEASISSLNPSPPYLRCKFCQGKLLRGLQSLICVYCGECQKKELHPDPISFNSTNGYTWLLQSLNFNGSERIGSLAEASGINGGQSPAEDELTLSELLNLKISLENIPEKPENSFSNSSLNLDTTDVNNFFTKSKSKGESVSGVLEEQPVVNETYQNKTVEDRSSLNLDTTDFDNFFTKSKSKSANVSDVLEEQPGANNADQDKIFEGQESFASDWNAEFQFADAKLENVKPVSVDPFEGAAGDLDSVFTKSKRSNGSDVHKEQVVASKSDQESLTSDWNAEFQFADTKLDKEKPVSVDPFEGTEVDLSAHMDAAFGPTKTLDSKKPGNDFDPFQDDLFANVNTMIPPEKSKSNLDNSDWFQNSLTTANIMVNKDDDDGFGEWNDFTSSTGNQDSVKDSIQDLWKESGVNEKMSDLNLFQSAVDSQEVDYGDFLQSEVFTGNRNANANTEAGNNVEESKNDEITLNASTGPKDDVQMLMSQMHDLSFMLKDKLSIPSNPNDIGSFHS